MAIVGKLDHGPSNLRGPVVMLAMFSKPTHGPDSKFRPGIPYLHKLSYGPATPADKKYAI
jgi:hypothetical protein